MDWDGIASNLISLINDRKKELRESPGTVESAVGWALAKLFSPLVKLPRVQTPAPLPDLILPDVAMDDSLPQFNFVGANLRGHYVPDGRISSTILSTSVLDKCAVPANLHSSFADILLDTYFHWLGRTYTFVESILDTTRGNKDAPSIWLAICDDDCDAGIIELEEQDRCLKISIPAWCLRKLGVDELYGAFVNGTTLSGEEVVKRMPTGCLMSSKYREAWLRGAFARVNAEFAKASIIKDIRRFSQLRVREFMDSLLDDKRASLDSALNVGMRLSTKIDTEDAVIRLERFSKALQSIGIWSKLCGSNVVLFPVAIGDDISALTCIGDSLEQRSVSDINTVAKKLSHFGTVLSLFVETASIQADWLDRFYAHSGNSELKERLPQSHIRFACIQTVAIAQLLAGSIHEGSANEFVFYVCDGAIAKAFDVVSEELKLFSWPSEDKSFKCAHEIAAILRANYAVFTIANCAAYIDPLPSPGHFALTRLVSRSPLPETGWVVTASSSGVTLIHRESGKEKLHLKWARSKDDLSSTAKWVDLTKLREQLAEIVRTAFPENTNWAEFFGEQAANILIELSEAPNLGGMLVLAPNVTSSDGLLGKGKAWGSLLIDEARMEWTNSQNAENVEPRLLRAMLAMDGATAVDSSGPDVGKIVCACHFEPPATVLLDLEQILQDLTADQKMSILAGLGTRRRTVIAIANYLRCTVSSQGEVLCVSSDGPIYQGNHTTFLTKLFPPNDSV
jgi:hypothetical protein